MDFKKLADLRNRENPFAAYIGCEIKEIREGYARTELPVTEKCMNIIGSVHGGCLYTIADVTCGSAAVSYGELATTVNSSFQYLRPGIGATKIIAEATAVKHGRRILVFDVRITDQDGTVLCTGTFNFIGIGKPVILN